eukprot:COSAG01_NODE_17849_length_1119_cov_22.911765_1_plen_91_part_10
MRGPSLDVAPVTTCAGRGADLDLITDASRRYLVCCVVDGSTALMCKAQASRPSGGGVPRTGIISGIQHLVNCAQDPACPLRGNGGHVAAQQ